MAFLASHSKKAFYCCTPLDCRLFLNLQNLQNLFGDNNFLNMRNNLTQLFSVILSQASWLYIRQICSHGPLQNILHHRIYTVFYQTLPSLPKRAPRSISCINVLKKLFCSPCQWNYHCLSHRTGRLIHMMAELLYSVNSSHSSNFHNANLGSADMVWKILVCKRRQG